MKSNYQKYDFEKSKERINNILNTSDLEFTELKNIPTRDKLTHNNGFYVQCTSMFVDIRKSTQMATKYRKATLARIYKCYISEVVAIINGNNECVEICIEGDCVWGIFNTTKKAEIDGVVNTAAQISSIINILNSKLKVKNLDPISIGIGIDYGSTLMVKAGHSGTGVNDVVWMGEVVAMSSKLASYGNRNDGDQQVMISETLYTNINQDLKSLFSYNSSRICYHGNIIIPAMKE